MRIVELILDEEQEEGGIEAISIVESPAIESDFVALNNQEIKLAEIDKESSLPFTPGLFFWQLLSMHPAINRWLFWWWWHDGDDGDAGDDGDDGDGDMMMMRCDEDADEFMVQNDL